MDETLENAENIEKPMGKLQEPQLPLHSTPKRPTKHNDPQDLGCHRVSPIFLPMTQDGGNEVAWDWQSPVTKSKNEKSKTNGESSSTPKRKNFHLQKRNLNSPLLYNPIKRKLLKSDGEKESVDKFTEKMRALSEQIKTVPKDNENRETLVENENLSESEDDLFTQIDMGKLVEFDSKLDENPIPKKDTVAKMSFDDLFDESLNESMVKCSQEVEEKLKLESCRDNLSHSNLTKSSTKDISWHLPNSRNVETKNKSKVETKNSSKSSTNSSKSSQGSFTAVDSKSSILVNVTSKGDKIPGVAKNSKSRELPKPPEVKKLPEISKPAVNSTKNDIYEIPDDSFDEFLAVCIDDVEKKVTAETSRYGKTYASPHSSVPNDKSRRFENSTAKKVLLPPLVQASSSIVKNNNPDVRGNSTSHSFVSHSESSDNLKTGPTKASRIVSQSPNQERKFFKSKSLSTSNFVEESANKTRSSTTTGKGWKSNVFVCGNNSSSVSTQRSANQQNNQNHAWQLPVSKPGNTGISNVVNRNVKKEAIFNIVKTNDRLQDGRVAAEASRATQSTTICTPAEIERKRMEAKMKLEAKRRLMARSASAGTLDSSTQAASGGWNNRPVKR